MDSKEKFIVVHDQNPDYAGAVAHLLKVGFDTPVFKNSVRSKISILHLGELESLTPLSSIIVGEKCEFSELASENIPENMICLVSFSGCSESVLDGAKSGLKDLPILSLPQMWSTRGLVDFRRTDGLDSFVRRHSLRAKAVSELFEDIYQTYCTDPESTAVFIADCTVNFIQTIKKISEASQQLSVNNSLIEISSASASRVRVSTDGEK